MELYTDVQEQYRDFLEYVQVESPTFEDWTRGVLGDEEMLAWIGRLPAIKRQPNLVFAAARFHGAPAPGPYAGMREVVLGRPGEVRATIESRSTQTNEVGRLATLVPVLGLLSGPLSLVEAGASAGLVLFPDRHDYRWSGAGELSGSGGPLLTARASGRMPVPSRHPEVAWRGGVDLNPLDVTDPEAMAWLRTLVWPEDDERRARLTVAIDVARAEPPRLRAGDLVAELPDLVDEAARHGTPVVFHSAVIAYLEPARREEFHDLMTGLVAQRRCHWISNEGPRVLPRISGDLQVPPGRFVTALDGRPVAVAHGHGKDLAWLSEPSGTLT